jgi:outer membrane protein TolC
VRSAERQLAAATEQIGVAVAALFPEITLTGNTFSGGALAGSAIGYESGTINKLLQSSSNFWSVGPALRWDMIDFGRTRANIAVQTSLQKQALLTYEQTVIASLRDVEGALVAYFDEQKRLASFAEQVIADKRSLQLTEDLYQAGLASDLAVLEARKMLIASESSLVGSEQSLTSDLIALYKALGGHWECCSLP